VKLAKVVGTVVATVKDPSIKGLKILMIQPVNDSQKAVGTPIAAIDMAQAGLGDLVWWIMSREASLALPNPFAPVDATITGIVDHVYQNDVGIRDKEKIFGQGKSK
jgi:ethanolamine utilization protein EutN